MQIPRTFFLAALLLPAACGFDDAQTSNGVQPVYDDNTAFVLVGQEVPPGKRDYYLFDFAQGKTVQADAKEILQGMRENPLHSAYIGIIGPDPAYNLDVIRAVVKQRSNDAFPNLHLIYVGPAAQQQAVRQILQPLGTQLQYVIYP